MAEKNNNRTFWIGALVGGVVGGVTALLLAPKSGRELRQDLADGAKQVTEKTADFVGAAREKKNGFKRSFQEWRNGSSEEQLNESIANVSSIDAGVELEEVRCEDKENADFVI